MRDRAFFEAQSISKNFLDKIFDAPSNRIWHPSHEQLLQSGAVHSADYSE